VSCFHKATDALINSATTAIKIAVSTNGSNYQELNRILTSLKKENVELFERVYRYNS
jgi:hypothetical protein